jgi:hypothetical protein
MTPNNTPETLGRFGHHPNPADDFCIEVECLQGEWENHKIGFVNGTPSRNELDARVSRAMEFRVGGVPAAMSAKDTLRQIERGMRS